MADKKTRIGLRSWRVGYFSADRPLLFPFLPHRRAGASPPASPSSFLLGLSFFGPHTCEVIPATVTPSSSPPTPRPLTRSEELRPSSRIPLTQPERRRFRAFVPDDVRPAPLLRSSSYSSSCSSSLATRRICSKTGVQRSVSLASRNVHGQIYATRM